LEPFWAQTSSASSLAHLGSKGSALSKLGKEKVTSTSACQIHEAINQENQGFTSLLFKVTIIDLILFRALHFFILLLNKKRERERERERKTKQT
jgi:preprotein translocase subunit SecG